MSDVVYDVRKISTLPLKSPVVEADLIVIVGDGTPPDGYLGSVADLAALAGTYAPVGPAGAQGPQGPVGPTGANLQVTGSVPAQTDLAALVVPVGTVYVVASDGSLWVFTGPAAANWTKMLSATGAQGPQGPPGAQGIQGVKGDVGPAGAQGIAGANVPTGVVLDYAGQVAPAGFVLCDGGFYAPADPTYAPLFNIIGYLYGQDGSGNFRTPPFNGRIAVSRDPANVNMGTTGKLGGRADTPLRAHRHGAGSLTMPNHSHDIAHGHPQGLTNPGYPTPFYLHLPGSESALYVQGRTSGSWPPPRRGMVGIWPAPLAEGAWDFLFADGNNNVSLQGDGVHQHYFQTPGLAYGQARSEAVSGAVGGETQDQGEQTGVTTSTNYPPFITINKIIRL